MNSASVSFRLIIVHEAPEEAQRLSSMFHNAGKPCRAQHINNQSQLEKILDGQSWDLIITHNTCESLPLANIVRQVNKLNNNTPVIMLTDEFDNKIVVDSMKLGACDVAQIDDDQHLLLIVDRELNNVTQQKINLSTQRKLKEVEQRNQKLLDSSRDGIAFIQDGMYLYANDSYAEMLGHNNRDSVEFMPIMDSIIDADHQSVKQTLKNFSLQKDLDDNKQLSFTTLLPDGNEKKIIGELFISEYDEEPCTQLVCYAKLENQEEIEAELQNIRHKDALTGLYNRIYLLEALENALERAKKTKKAQSFIFIDIDRFSRKVKNNINITDTDKLVKNIADSITEHYSKNNIFARVSDHAFAIISEENEPGLLIEQSNQLCKKFSEHLFEIGNKTLQLTLSIGISLINETTKDSQTLIHHALQSIESLRNTQDGNGVNIYQKEAEASEVLASSFKKALENDDFHLLFQPILSLRGEDIERYEVLLRMEIENKEISPSKFLSIAQGLNLSTKIDRWVILESIKYLQKNNKKNQNKTQQFINLTNDSLCDETLLPWLQVALKASNIKASSIIFQAKEADITQHLIATKKFAEEANKLGIDFCITNFGGSTLEPLATLNHINAKYIKIDGSLSLEIQENPDNIQNLETLVKSLLKQNKITTIPHIEKASILSKLWQLGVHCIQGNYLQPPGSAMDYEFSPDN